MRGRTQAVGGSSSPRSGGARNGETRPGRAEAHRRRGQRRSNANDGSRQSSSSDSESAASSNDYQNGFEMSDLDWAYQEAMARGRNDETPAGTRRGDGADGHERRVGQGRRGEPAAAGEATGAPIQGDTRGRPMDVSSLLLAGSRPARHSGDAGSAKDVGRAARLAAALRAEVVHASSEITLSESRASRRPTSHQRESDAAAAPVMTARVQYDRSRRSNRPPFPQPPAAAARFFLRRPIPRPRSSALEPRGAAIIARDIRATHVGRWLLIALAAAAALAAFVVRPRPRRQVLASARGLASRPRRRAPAHALGADPLDRVRGAHGPHRRGDCRRARQTGTATRARSARGCSWCWTRRGRCARVCPTAARGGTRAIEEARAMPPDTTGDRRSPSRRPPKGSSRDRPPTARASIAR